VTWGDYVAGWETVDCCVDISTDFYGSSQNISEVILFILPTSRERGPQGEGGKEKFERVEYKGKEEYCIE